MFKIDERVTMASRGTSLPNKIVFCLAKAKLGLHLVNGSVTMYFASSNLIETESRLWTIFASVNST